VGVESERGRECNGEKLRDKGETRSYQVTNLKCVG
jgi:hypothetical protein